MTTRAVFRSTGSYLPKKILTNKDMESIVDTTADWIEQRSGIKQRHIAADDENTAHMAIEAGRRALERSGLTAADIDTVIVATTTPDQTFPAVAVKVQDALDIPPGIAFDVQAVCTGFVYALATANNFIIAGQSKRVLVIGAEKMSALMNWEDRTTCVLFGDGAGAVILEAQEGNGTLDNRGIFSSHLYANGAQRDLLYVDGGVSTTGLAGHLIMQGREVFKYAVQYMSGVVEEALQKNGVSAGDIDWLVPHQANIRILEATAQKLGVSMDKVIVTLQNHGNTSAASIPLALDAAVKDGRVKKGDMLLIEGMGGGLTWGSVLARF